MNKLTLSRRRLFVGVSTAIALSMTSAVNAAPAADLLKNYVQPSGATIQVTAAGDEWFGWWETAAGDVLVRNSMTQYLEYAKAVQNGDQWNLQPSGVVFGNPLGSFTPITISQVIDYWNSNKVLATQEQSYVYSAGAVNGEVPPDSVGQEALDSGGVATRPLLIIMINFTDQQIESTDAAWSNKFFGAGFGSVNHYFNEVTYGQFQLTPANETYGSANDGIVQATLNYAHPNPGRSTQQDMLIEATNQIDQYVDFSQYDTDGDGHVEANELQIGYIVAGGESAILGSDIGVWAHVTAFGDHNKPVLDGVDIANTGWGRYFRAGEKHRDGKDASIGILAHEMGHSALFLPDLYDTSDARGISYWGIMGQGSWGRETSDQQLGDVPTHFSAYSKVDMGVVVAEEKTDGNHQLHEATSQDYNVIKVPTQSEYEYFLIENRQNTGYDRGVTRTQADFYNASTGGVAVWHINMSANGPKRVMLERAIENEYASKVTDLYWQGNNALFASDTTPNSNLVDDTQSGVVIQVGASGAAINVTIGDGQPPNESQLCEATTDTIGNHVAAGRAYQSTVWNGWYWATTYLATGSGDTLGAYTYLSATVKETDTGYFEVGDCVGPTVSIANVTPLGSNGITASGTSAAGDDELSATEYRIDGSGAWASVNGLANWTVEVTGLSDGNHTLNVRAVDAAGRVSETSQSFDIGSTQSGACITADNISHVNAGRANYTGPVTLRRAAAVGSGDDLGYAMITLNNYSTLLEQSSGYWVKVVICP